MRVRTTGALAILGAIVIFALSVSAQKAQTSESSASESILRRTALMTHDRVNTTSALTMALSSAGIPGGIVTVSGCGEDVTYIFRSSGVTLRDVLNAIVATNPQYAWRINRGAINVTPKRGYPSLLNLRISELNVREARSVDEALSQILVIPEVQKRIHELNLKRGFMRIGMRDLRRPGSVGASEPHYNFSLRNVTFREALNAIARAHGRAVWEYRERHCDGKVEFQIQFLVR